MLTLLNFWRSSLLEHDIISATVFVTAVATNTALVFVFCVWVSEFFFFLHVCDYVPLVKLSHVPVSCKQGLVILFPLDPLYLLSLRSPLLSNLHLFLSSLNAPPFLLIFFLKPSILLSRFPSGLPAAPTTSYLCSLRSALHLLSFLQLNFTLAPFFTAKPLFLYSKLPWCHRAPGTIINLRRMLALQSITALFSQLVLCMDTNGSSKLKLYYLVLLGLVYILHTLYYNILHTKTKNN